MVTLLVAMLYLSVSGACARLAHPEQVDMSCDPNIRSIWKVIWSCMATIFSCTWVALHLNVPKQGKPKLWKFGRRFCAFAIALIAPEYIISQAWSQRASAKKIAATYAGHNWTITHGFFVNMGGFRVHDEGSDSDYVMNSVDIKVYLDDGQITVSEEDIQDKSKGDMFTKGFAVLQTAWFILQLVARAVQQLSITELEIATLAFAILNGATYFLWWNKPLDVQCPIILNQHTSVVNIDANRIRNRTGGGYVNGEDSLQLPLMGPEKHDHPRRIRNVKMFDETTVASDSYILSAVAVLFGAIHCVAWFSHFPTILEKLLWEGACVAIIIMPIMAAVLTLTTARDHYLPKSVIHVPFILSFVLYFTARLILVVLTLTTLRSLPHDAYTTAHWPLEFIPHI